jgi:uncharacterized protein
MNLPETGYLMRIFIGESDHCEGKPLYEWIVLKAREQGMAGATVLRGMMGYGPNSRIYTNKILRLSEDLPLIIEIIDAHDKLENFLTLIEPHVGDGLITMEKVYIKLYRSKSGSKPE